MESTLAYWLLQVVAMLLTVLLIPRLRVSGIFGVLLMVGAIAAVNAFLWDSRLFFALPETFSGRAVQLLVVNGLIFWALVKLLPGIEVDGVLPAIAAPVVFTLCSLAARSYGGEVDWAQAFSSGAGWLTETMDSLRAYFKS